MSSALADVRRFEIKYGISPIQSFALQGRLASFLPPDANNRGSLGYMVRSLYFDSADDKDFAMKIAGSEEHKKIRLRVYALGSKTAKLELKEKTGKWQRKRSLTLQRAEAERLAAGDFSPLLRSAEPLAEQLYNTMTVDAYRPRCIVQYRRTAFMLPVNDTRITFDSRIEATESNFDLFSDQLVLYPACDPCAVVLEVKYDRFLLSHIGDAVSSVDKTPQAISKYIMARQYGRKLGRL